MHSEKLNTITWRPMKEEGTSLPKAFLAGALSGAVSATLFQPLDLVKTRIQAPIGIGQYAGKNTALHTVNSKGLGMVATFNTVVRTDSITGLWKGLTPTISKTVPGVGMYFCTLHWMKGFVKSEPSALQSVALGFSARTVAGVSLLPVAVVKTRYESGQFQYRGVTQALTHIWRHEGVRGLFSGCAATVARDAPFSGIYLMFYTQLKSFYIEVFGPEQINPNVHFATGVCAGILSSGLTQPADVIKTQLQLYPNHYKGTVHCVIAIINAQGARGMFKGMLPRCIRRTLMAAMSWTVFESVMKQLHLRV